MEIDGHPTQDLVEELENRGAVKIPGTTAGPDESSLRSLADAAPGVAGSWLFLPRQTYATGFDEIPGP
jgi:hypothetical protein